jgi:hypothetical protein
MPSQSVVLSVTLTSSMRSFVRAPSGSSENTAFAHRDDGCGDGRARAVRTRQQSRVDFEQQADDGSGDSYERADGAEHSQSRLLLALGVVAVT